MKEINKKEIVINELNKELKFYKSNKKKFNIDEYNLAYMKLIIEHIKTYDIDDDLFDAFTKEPNLLLNLVTDIANIEVIDRAIFDEIFGNYFENGQVGLNFVCDEDEFESDKDEGYIHDNEDC